MRLRLLRHPSRVSGTLGELFQVTLGADGLDAKENPRWCWTYEDVVREVAGQPVAQWKIHGETAIPEGIYRVTFTQSVRFQTVMPELLDVPGFTGVRLHSGNTASQTEGCVLVGTTPMPTQDGVLQSRDAFAMVFQRLYECWDDGDPIMIDIRNAP